MGLKQYIGIIISLAWGMVNPLKCFSQSASCPPNIDFSFGNFTNWELKTGIVSGYGGQNSVIWTGTGEVIDRHQLIPPDNQQMDEFGDFPKHCPGTNNYSVKLGNDNNGHEAEGLIYTFTIPANNNNFALTYYYAVVLQNPGHLSFEQPRFRTKVIDVASGDELKCVSFDFVASASLLGFKPTRWGNAVYKGWTPVTVDLSGNAGKTIRLEFITSDCVFDQHFGYAYVCIASSCNNSIQGANFCENDPDVTIKAPYGYMEYQWYSDNNFSTLIGATQELHLNTGTAAVGSTFPVIVFPYEGFGCQDTLYATLGKAIKPIVNAGPDVTVCSKGTVKVGEQGNVEYSYEWFPNSAFLNPNAPAPTTRPGIRQPVNFLVTATDMITGCKSNDTVFVTPILLDTATYMSGKEGYCQGETINTTLTLNNNAAQVQWFNGNTKLNLTGYTANFTEPGTYWVQLKQFGCIDSTRQFNVRMVPPIKADFVIDREVQCVNSSVYMRNMSSPVSENLVYKWQLSDGFTSSFKDIERVMTYAGIRTVSLVATAPSGCKDSVSKTIRVLESCMTIVPDAFTPNNDGLNDVFRPFVTGKARLKSFTIYNRFGNIVFKTQKAGEGWDGMLNGKLQPTGVFIWKLEYINEKKQEVMEKGTVLLIN